MIADPNLNHVFQYTFANSVIAAYLGWQDTRNDRRNAVEFGNKEKMPEEVLESIAAYMDQAKVMHEWREGDIMAVNNQRKFES